MGNPKTGRRATAREGGDALLRRGLLRRSLAQRRSRALDRRAAAAARAPSRRASIEQSDAGAADTTGQQFPVYARLLTPPLSSGCLAGVTRDLALEITDAAEETVPLSALAEAEEAFVTSTTRNVHPISAVDGVPLLACPGPATTSARQAFAALMAETLDPWVAGANRRGSESDKPLTSGFALEEWVSSGLHTSNLADC